MIRILLSSRLGDLKWSQADLARKTGIRPTIDGYCALYFCKQEEM